MPAVVALARRYRWSDIPLAGLVQEGVIGLLEVGDRFDQAGVDSSPTPPGGCATPSPTTSGAPPEAFACPPDGCPPAPARRGPSQYDEASWEELAAAEGLDPAEAAALVPLIGDPISLDAPLGDADAALAELLADRRAEEALEQVIVSATADGVLRAAELRSRPASCGFWRRATDWAATRRARCKTSETSSAPAHNDDSTLCLGDGREAEMPRLRRLLTVLLAMGMVTLVVESGAGAAPRGEHFKEIHRFTEPGIDNPCTPEFDNITITGTDRVQGFTRTENGETSFETHMTGHANGVAADGTEYEAKLNAKESGSFNGTETVHFEVIGRFISHGSAPNFLVREEGTFTAPPPHVTFELQQERGAGASGPNPTLERQDSW